MKIAIIGAGNIGGATAIGLCASGKYQITVTAAHPESLVRFEKYGIETSLQNVEAVRDAQVIIIAVKPWIVPDVLRELSPVIDVQRQIVVSMAPGVGSSELLELLPEGVSLAYVIPNTAIELGESMTFVAPVTASDPQTQCLVDIFENAGRVALVSEKALVPGTSLASCGIAYALQYIKAAAEGGVQLGFSPEEAEKIVSQTVRGALTILQERGSHPKEEIERVTTPGGMTLKGLEAMERNGFTNAVVEGLTANNRE